jgi:hypothetical protein
LVILLLGIYACGGGTEPVPVPSQIEKIAGDGEVGTPGQPVTTPPAVLVKDASGNPVAGVAVTFEVISGGGSITGPSATTNASGIANVGSWVLGDLGANVLRATAAGSSISGNPVTFTVSAVSGFNIEVRFIGEVTASQRRAFAEAEARWETLVTGDLPDVQVTSQPGECGPESVIDDMVDDLLILVSLEDIDGQGEVLGSAGPCFVRDASNTPVLGAIRFDTADVSEIEAGGLLPQVVVHEMAHVLGYGIGGTVDGLPILWDRFLVDPSLTPGGEVTEGTDPHFMGPQAVAAFDQSGGSTYSGGKVPVEDKGGPGTADSHWRESVFGTELMTGFINTGQNPLSRVSVASLADLGYEVNLAAADEFSLSLAFARSATSHRLVLGNDVLRLPIRKVDARGRITGVLRR